MNTTNNKQHYIKICPHCGSTHVRFTDLKIDAGPIGDCCEDCELGRLTITHFPEVEATQVDAFRAEIEEFHSSNK